MAVCLSIITIVIGIVICVAIVNIIVVIFIVVIMVMIMIVVVVVVVFTITIIVNPQRALQYEITGDGLASTLFRLDVDTGLITLAQSLRSDDANSYVVSRLSLPWDRRAVRESDMSVGGCGSQHGRIISSSSYLIYPVVWLTVWAPM